jgi:hypothetical protein
MLATFFDPGVAGEPRTRPLTGHSIAVFEPDPRLCMLWPVAEDDDHLGRYERSLPEWAADRHFKSGEARWSVIMLGGAPVWQSRLWYLDWGSGIGGYVADFSPQFARDAHVFEPVLEGWRTSEWAVAHAGLINAFSPSREWDSLDPTFQIDPQPSQLRPIDAMRAGV